MLGTPEIILICVVVLLLFGGKKIPELMKGLGKGVKSFKDGMNGIDQESAKDEKATTYNKVMGVGAFSMKDWLFRLVLWPRSSDFPTYRWLGAEPFRINLVNTELTEQFMIHMKVALVAGLLVASPYIIYVLFRFISPALYDNERRAGIRLIGASYTMFMIGLVVNYLLVFPLTVRFLGTYSVSADITNLLTLSSYVDTLLLLSLLFGIIFEIPVVAWLLARFGMLKASWMSQYRRHAIVAILIIAAVITPTADIMTLFVVSLPIWLLYEASIWIVKWTSPPAPSPVLQA